MLERADGTTTLKDQSDFSLAFEFKLSGDSELPNFSNHGGAVPQITAPPVGR